MDTYHAYAKINLSLEILGRRTDGYHDLLSVMQTISLADTLEVEAAPAGELTVRCDVPELDANPQGNLVWRAARILQQARHVSQGARLTLTKRIPLAAGLGGGSSDAAVALRALDRLWDLQLTGAELLNAARLLGADVPFFLRGGTALIEGKGDQVTELRPLAPCWIVLITPEVRVPEKTKTLYGALRVHERTNGVLTRHLVNALAQGDVPSPALLYNGFEDPAFRLFDGLAELQETITAAGGDAARLSGSGPSMFALYPTQEEAATLAARLQALDIPVQVVTLGVAQGLMTTTIAPVQAPEEIVELRPRLPLQHTLARWLTTLKPEWYPSASAASSEFEHEFARAGQTLKIWVVVQNARPRAWLMARLLPDERRQVEIVRLGAEVSGRYESAAPACAPLIARVVAWATEQGAAHLIHWTGSEGLAIHGQALEDLWTAMQHIGGGDSPVWAFWVEQEFMLWGLLPDLYGPRRHGALLARRLER